MKLSGIYLIEIYGKRPVPREGTTSTVTNSCGAEELLEQAENRNWDVVSMKNDFITIFPAVNEPN
jgi:hypothetical protein